MRTLQRVGVGLLALTLAGGITACGDDDSDEGTTDTTTAGTPAEGDDAAFCDAVVDFNTVIFGTDTEDATEDEVKEIGAELAPLSQALVDEAPDAVVDAAESVHAFVEPLADGDTTAFDDDSSFETYLGFLEAASAECEFAEVEVTASDYAFDAPDTIEAGTVSFAFTNASDAEEHEMIVFSKADGVDLSFDEILALPEEEGESMTVFATAAFAAPGEGGSTLATLEPGDYAMVCFIPVGRRRGRPAPLHPGDDPRVHGRVAHRTFDGDRCACARRSPFASLRIGDGRLAVA